MGRSTNRCQARLKVASTTRVKDAWSWHRVYWAVLLGYASHLFLDNTTPSGVPLFYPHPSRHGCGRNARWWPSTGSPGERVGETVLEFRGRWRDSRESDARARHGPRA